MSTRSRTFVAVLFAALIGGCAAPTPERTGLDRIDTVVVIYAENHSFDNLYGMFPGAEGVANATVEQTTQLDLDGKPLAQLPPVWGPDGKALAQFSHTLPNKPFRIDAPPVSKRMNELVPSPIHAFWHHQEQINGGANNRFVAMTTVGAWVMGYYDGSSMRLWQWAREYTLADHFFQAAFGGSFFNHFWLVCACTPEFRNAPASIRAQLDEQGRLKRRPTSPPSVMSGPVQVFDGQVTPDGYAVNTSQPPYQPSGTPPAENGDRNLADPAKNPVPAQTHKTIGDTLSAKGISWAWYSGGWNVALADGRQDPKAKRAIIYNREPSSPNFQPHHQPFNYFARFAPGTPDRAQHLKDGDDFVRDVDAGALQARRAQHAAPELHRRRHRRRAHRRSARASSQEPAMEPDGRDRHVRRERRLLGPRPAAEGTGLGRPLGTRLANSRDHRVAVREKGLR
jgi:phospholipase C